MKRALLLVVVIGCGSDEPPARRRPRPVPVDPDVPFGYVPPANAPDAGARAGQPQVFVPSGAHPDYPTPRSAGTEDLFFLEEPVRGPHVTKLAMPDRKALTFEVKAYCEIDELTVVCGREAATAKDKASVSVGMDRGRPALIEWKRGKHVDQTVVLSYNAVGAIERMARLDATGTIDWVRTYAPAGKRYTARELDGSNALDGCGAIDVATDNGRATKRTCLQWLGEEMRDTNGVVATAYERDVDGFVIVETRESFAGRQVAGQRDFVHRIETTRDKRGRPTKARYQAVAGHAADNADQHGCAGLYFEYDKNQESQRRCVNGDGQLTADEDGVYIVDTERDARGCAIATRHLDDHRKPAARDGIHELRDEVDDHCYASVSTCIGLGGARIECGPGEPAEYRYTRDAHGWITSTTYIAADGTAGYDPNYAVHEVRSVWDDLGNKLEEACFDSYGSPTGCGSTGFHKMVDVYDSNGRSTQETFLDTYGYPTTNMGTSVRKYVYDNYDHLSEAQDYDANGDLFEVQGMAIKRNYYDDSHRLFGIVLLDKLGKPAMYSACYTGVYCPGNTSIPWHAVRLIRSPMGRVITNEYFDTDGQIVETVDCKVHQCWTD